MTKIEEEEEEDDPESYDYEEEEEERRCWKAKTWSNLLIVNHRPRCLAAAAHLSYTLVD